VARGLVQSGDHLCRTNNYADATDRMKHYLELAPDAPDAKDAREQMIIWEDKAKH